MEKLAIDGGTPVRGKPFPTVNNISGRDIGKEEEELLIQVIRSGRLNRNNGEVVKTFEKEFAERYKVKHAIASTSGTASLHIAVAALELNPGDEVITTTITDMGTVMPILLCNCIPIFADVDPLTAIMTPESIEKQITSKTKAIIVVHLLGQPAPMDEIMAIAKKHKLKVIEDCCQAHLAEYKGKMIGTIGDLGCFSFQQSKQITSGDGGVTITNDEKLGGHARLFSDKGWPRNIPGYRGHAFLGINYRMTELQGAVALAQLRKVDRLVGKRRKTAEKLTELIKKIKGINPPKIIDGVKHSYWQYAFTIDEKLFKVNPHKFLEALNKEGVPFGIGYLPSPVFEYDLFKNKKTYGDSFCPYTCKLARQGIKYDRADYPDTIKMIDGLIMMLWNEGISEEDVSDIAKAISKVADAYRK